MAATRDRIVTATGELFRRHGYNGTSLKQVTVAADAPFGSLYHFFPGGKEELADAVLRTSGAAYRELFEVIFDAAPDAAQAVTDFFDGAALVLEETGYVDACPIGTVALEVASTNDRLRQTTADVFATWTESATDRLRAAGIDDAARGGRGRRPGGGDRGGLHAQPRHAPSRTHADDRPGAARAGGGEPGAGRGQVTGSLGTPKCSWYGRARSRSASASRPVSAQR